MQQFTVPQFIEVEDKILGPITIRQFLILLAGTILIFLGVRFGDYSLKIASIVVVGGSSLVLAFVKVNGQPFHYFMLNIFGTLRKPGLRVWAKDYTREELEFLRIKDTEPPPEVAARRAPPKRERIRDLSLLVNTGGYYRPEDEA